MNKSILALLGVASVWAGDWPQWRGPDRTGYVGEKLEKLPTEPKVNWKKPSSEGLSSPVVASGKVFHFEAENGREVLRALNAKDGKVLWNASVDNVMSDNQ